MGDPRNLTKPQTILQTQDILSILSNYDQKSHKFFVGNVADEYVIRVYRMIVKTIVNEALSLMKR